MLRMVFLFILATAANAQNDGRPWPVGSGQQQPNPGLNPSGSSFQSNQSPSAGGAPFGQNLPGQNQQQPWLAGSNPQFGASNPSFGSQPQHPNAMQNLGQVPPNNPPPGTVTGADRAVLGSGGSNPQWGGMNGQPNSQFGSSMGGQPNWQQPGQPNLQGPGQPMWNGGGQPNNPANPSNPNPNQPPTPSTPYPPVQGRPYYGAASSYSQLSCSVYILLAVACLMRYMA